jgi:cell division protein FtsL
MGNFNNVNADEAEWIGMKRIIILLLCYLVRYSARAVASVTMPHQTTQLYYQKHIVLEYVDAA